MKRDRTLSDLRLPIAGRPLALFLRHVLPTSTSTHEAVGRKVLGSGFRSAAGGINSIVSVIDGKRPANRFHRTVEHGGPRIGNHPKRRHCHFSDPSENLTVHVSQLSADQADW